MRVLLACLGLIPALLAAAETDCARPNRLTDAGSPYLLQHACNPVDWHPWSVEAIEKARREGKPIFVSVGYSTCYWCHVANRTLFENPAVAALLNAHFIAIKIDREQRPDLDRLFMAATLVLAGSGGWPNNLFLTPELEPFFAGSYFPPHDDEYGRIGLLTLLGRIRDDWRERRVQIVEHGKRVSARLRDQVRAAAGEPKPDEWRREALARIVPRLDRAHGGMRTAGESKFPQPALVDYLLAEHAARPNAGLREAVAQALGAMASGGIHDHLGGGFHRYTVDRRWSVPHFEKMLYDNAQLLALYARAWQATGKAAWRETARGTALFLLRDLQAPEGGFYTALDSGAGGEEGRPYVWPREEIVAALGSREAARFFESFEIVPAVPRETTDPLADEAGVLRLREGKTGKAPPRLLEIRRARPQPARDEKQVLALNGLAIAALAQSAGPLAAPAQLEAARRAGERLWTIAWNAGEGRLAHELYRGRPQGDGLLEDYAHLARGFLALHEAGAGAQWRDRAGLLMSATLKRLQRPDGRLAASNESARLPIPLDDVEDYVYPSGTSAAIEVMLRLGGDVFLAAAGRALAAAGGQIGAAPGSWPALLAVLTREEGRARRALALAQPAAAEKVSLPDTAKRVAVSARLLPAAGAVLLELTLRIEPGWHVNANPASFDYLVPARLLIDGAVPRRIVYPPGRPFRAGFAPETIQVYEGRVTILAEFPPGAADRLRARLAVQACNEEVCLVPATLEVPLR
ncbi:MAG: DUF255 domain-containing protein [Betaproteobacteria bacterium]|nr:DUF255 domain-containing protein [Betaproteobacteria bacterium]